MNEKLCTFPGCDRPVLVKTGPGRKHLYCDDLTHNAVTAFRARKAQQIAPAADQVQVASDQAVALAGGRLRLVAESIGDTLAKQRAWLNAETDAVVAALADLNDVDKVEAQLAAMRAEVGQDVAVAQAETATAQAETSAAQRAQAVAQAIAEAQAEAATAAQDAAVEAKAAQHLATERAVAAEAAATELTTQLAAVRGELEQARLAAATHAAQAEAATKQATNAETRASQAQSQIGQLQQQIGQLKAQQAQPHKDK